MSVRYTFTAPNQHHYDLGRFYSLEEVYAHNLHAYYAALQIHPQADYYDGRAKADLTPWLEYFLQGVAALFQRVASEVREQARHSAAPEPAQLRRLDRRARIVLGLFSRQESVTAAEMARSLGLAARTVRDLIGHWLADGWLVLADPARKSRRYHLSAE